ncbi:hypothetical protein GAYE_PCTG71G1532 [Galdieria yellowstonensis]|uniref:Prefoldin subunit n=1 Tax=Galdieria yellowstonensis TaxID=3028027 RepID=A0AAV9I8G4_9RHOD|nr:hypothetical protein GAYE_PCTG71G1532 [Galdieria yellowstonensis]
MQQQQQAMLDRLLSKSIAKQKLLESIALDEQHSEILEDRARLNKRALEVLKTSSEDRETMFSLGRETFAMLPNHLVQSLLTAEDPQLWEQIENIQRKLPEKRQQLELLEEEIARLTEELLRSSPVNAPTKTV